MFSHISREFPHICHCTLQVKSNLCIPFLGIARLSPNFHIRLSVRDLYIPRIGPRHIQYFPAEE